MRGLVEPFIRVIPLTNVYLYTQVVGFFFFLLSLALTCIGESLFLHSFLNFPYSFTEIKNFIYSALWISVFLAYMSVYHVPTCGGQ